MYETSDAKVFTLVVLRTLSIVKKKNTIKILYMICVNKLNLKLYTL